VVSEMTIISEFKIESYESIYNNVVL